MNIEASTYKAELDYKEVCLIKNAMQYYLDEHQVGCGADIETEEELELRDMIGRLEKVIDNPFN